MSPRLGYNTNGFAHHALPEAVEIIAEIGFSAVGLTIDHGVLAPRALGVPAARGLWEADDLAEQLAALRGQLDRLQLRSAIETGARFLLDPRQKHEPTLMSPPAAQQQRLGFYRHAIDCADALGSDCVSIWSGALREPLPRAAALQRLVAGLREVLDYAAARRVTIAFEPEPGMFIDTLAAMSELDAALGDRRLGVTIDVGHLHCQAEGAIDELLAAWAPRLRNVHLDDARRGRHEHLMFGEGEIDFGPVLRALTASSYAGAAYVELSRHSHEAPTAARRAFAALDRLLG